MNNIKIVYLDAKNNQLPTPESAVSAEVTHNGPDGAVERIEYYILAQTTKPRVMSV